MATCASGAAHLSNTKLIRNYKRRHPHLAARVPELLPALKQAEAAESISTVLARQLDKAGVKYSEEHRFHPPRRWRLDFYFPTWRLAVEIEGLNHRKRDRYRRDLDKYNTLSADGIFLLRFTAAQVHDRSALHAIIAYLEARP